MLNLSNTIEYQAKHLFPIISKNKTSRDSVWFTSQRELNPTFVDEQYFSISQDEHITIRQKMGSVIKEIYNHTFLASFYKLFTSAAL